MDTDLEDQNTGGATQADILLNMNEQDTSLCDGSASKDTIQLQNQQQQPTTCVLVLPVNQPGDMTGRLLCTPT